MLLCACKNNMKPLKHFIIALPMFNTRRNRRIHISYKSWTQYTRYVVKDQSHESSRQRDTCHYPFTQLSTNKSVRSCCLDDVDWWADTHVNDPHPPTQCFNAVKANRVVKLLAACPQSQVATCWAEPHEAETRRFSCCLVTGDDETALDAANEV